MSYDDDPKLAEITRLNHKLTEMWALADDLATKLDRALIALRARAIYPNLIAEGEESLARYRETREQ